MKIKIVKQPISQENLKKLAKETFGDMVKAVVDVKRKILALGGQLHFDAETVLLKDGSKQKDIWGINLYPFEKKSKFIEYTALINIRPSQDNRDMEILDPKIRNEIKKTIEEKIKE